jgi:hypothetical protein
MKKRAVALPNPLVVDQLCEAIISKLSAGNCLLSSGSWVRIPPGTPPDPREAPIKFITTHLSRGTSISALVLGIMDSPPDKILGLFGESALLHQYPALPGS